MKIINNKAPNLVHMRMICQWCASFWSQTSYNVKGTTGKTHISTDFTQLQTGTKIEKYNNLGQNYIPIIGIQEENRINTHIEANSDGLSIAAHPAASAGATFQVAINRG